MPVKPNFTVPHLLVRGVTTSVGVTLYDDGAPVDPGTVTITIYDDSNAKIVDGASATVGGSPGYAITYSVSSSVIPTTLALSDEWLVEWVSSTYGTYRNPAVLAYRQAYPVISAQNMIDRYSIFSGQLPSGRSDWSWIVDLAWERIQRMLFARGRRAYQVISSYDLFDPHLELSLSLGFAELESLVNGPAKGRYESKRKEHADAFKAAWDGLVLTYYDVDQDGDTDGPELGSGVISFTAGPLGRSWLNRWP